VRPDSDRAAQNVSFAKSKSDTLAKLDGTYKQPAAAAPSVAVENQSSTLQQSIFAGPPGTVASSSAANGPPPGLKAPITDAQDHASPASQGVKRPREEESDDEKDDAPMDEDDDDDDAAMEESDPDE